MGVRRLQGSAR